MCTEVYFFSIVIDLIMLYYMYFQLILYTMFDIWWQSYVYYTVAHKSHSIAFIIAIFLYLLIVMCGKLQ